jgi:hypothetical protein
MAQKISIPVDADTTGAAASMKNLDGATAKVADQLNNTARAAEAVAKGIDAIERAQVRLQSALNRPVSKSDASTFLDNFADIRTRSSSVRRFGNFDSWWEGHGTAYAKPGQAAAHRRAVIAAGMQGTDYARERGENVIPGPGDGGGGGGGGGGGAGPAGGGVSSLLKGAKGFALAGLGLAGIQGVMAMAAKSLGLGQDESLSTSLNRRRLGLGKEEYNAVREATRGAAGDLYSNYAESAQLGYQFIRGAGNMRGTAGLGGMLSGAGNFASHFGIENGQSVDFFSSMKRMGVTSDADSQTRLAGKIADAIDRSGYAAKADDIVQAIGAYGETIARGSLSHPNVAGYASMLSAMTATGLPGLDPNGAAAALGQADGSLRRGGNAGEAGKNFLYRALSRPGMSPASVMGLMQGGLFASEKSIFGEGSALKGWGGASDSTDNLHRIKAMVKRSGMDPKMAALMMSNLFGGSVADNHELLTLEGKPLEDKKAIMKAAADKGDVGQQTLASIKNMESALTEAGGVLLKPIGEIRDAVVGLAHLLGIGTGAPASPPPKVATGFGPMGARMKADALAMMADPAAAMEMAGVDKALHLPKGATALQMQVESNRFAKGNVRGPLRKGGRARGWAQFMPATLEEYRGRFKSLYGHEPDPDNHIDSVKLLGLKMGPAIEKYGYEGALRAYNGGKPTSHNPETNDYVHKIMGGAGGGGKAELNHNVKVDVTLHSPDGKPIPHTSALRQQGSPVPWGQGKGS